jgi:5'-nucleotidase
VLVTNDDGIGAPGIAALAEAVRTCGHEPVVAAPWRDWSGMGAALGPVHVTGRIEYERMPLMFGDCESYAVDGPPALAVVAGCLGGFGPKPDAVVSGVNAGPNIGSAVLHSGTVGAALTAAAFGVPAVAVSLDLGPRLDYARAAALAARMLPDACPLGGQAVLNVNVPNTGVDGLRGVRVATLAASGIVQATVADNDGALQLTLPSAGPVDPWSDMSLLAAGYVTVTALRSVHPLVSIRPTALQGRMVEFAAVPSGHAPPCPHPR